MGRSYFYLDLNRPVGRLKVFQYDQDDLERELKDAGVADPRALTDLGDCHVFGSESSADRFLDDFSEAVRTLPRQKCEGFPHILLKQRYMALVTMGLKKSTWRPKRKPWAPGQVFVFHDQVHFVRVRLTKLTPEDGGFRYDFVLI